MRLSRALARMLFVMLAATVPLACGDDDDPAGAGSDVHGTYTLRSVNGDPVPSVVFEEDGYQEVIVSGSITLSAGSVCTTRLAFQEIQDGQVLDEGEDESSCTYSISGSTLTIDWGEDDTETLTISGNRLTLSEGGEVWIFEK